MMGDLGLDSLAFEYLEEVRYINMKRQITPENATEHFVCVHIEEQSV